jgi:2-polyprenyl-3-methyl-5-hydroxy-6-metoxy-1,4-benzoquinol methylase
LNFLSIEKRDPAGAGEDLLHDCQRVMELAPLFCSDCIEYHMLHPFKRYLSSNKGHADHSALTSILGRLLVKAASQDDGVINVVIGGAADAGLLGLSVRAAREYLQGACSRTRVSVLDRCPTPLALCSDYARRNLVDVVVNTVEFTRPSERFSADVVLLHSLLNFVDPTEQVQLMKTFASWLKPGGHLVVSTEIRTRAEEGGSRLRRSSRLSEVEIALRSGLVPVTGDLETLLAYVARASQVKASHLHEFSSPQELDHLFEEAGLRTLSVNDVDSRGNECHAAGGTHRMIWVLRR